jgi:ABC-2 type transport system ATP-binding protein
VLVDGCIVKIGPPSALMGTTSRAEIRYRRGADTVVIETDEPTRVLHDLTAEALAAGEELAGLEVLRPTLEDVYLELVDGETSAEGC